MALDSKQKRGSVLGFALPFRSWLAEPDGALGSTDRMSLLHYGSGVAAASPGGFQSAWARGTNVLINAQRHIS